MRVAVVIPAYNAEATLERCLEGCAHQTRAADEIWVVDDGSTDGTCRIAAAHGVHWLQQERLGPAAARNRGARAADAEIVVFTDSDCVPEAEWLERLLAGFGPGVVGVGGSYGIVNRDKYLARMVHEEIAARHAAMGADVDFLGSFNVAYRKVAFEAVVGFDETFTTASGEDNDLAYRLQDAGGVLRFVQEARVSHLHPERLWPYLRTQRRHGYWRVKLYRKHPRRVARGDRYAGLGDLIAPPLALALCVGFLALDAGLLTGKTPGLVVWPVALLSLGYGLMVARRTWRVVRRSGEFGMLGFAGVAALRDVARAVGLAQGVWAFYVRGGRL